MFMVVLILASGPFRLQNYPLSFLDLTSSSVLGSIHLSGFAALGVFPTKPQLALNLRDSTACVQIIFLQIRYYRIKGKLGDQQMITESKKVFHAMTRFWQKYCIFYENKLFLKIHNLNISSSFQGLMKQKFQLAFKIN